MKCVFNGKMGFVCQDDEDSDIYHIDFVPCYHSVKRITCHKVEVYDVVEAELEAMKDRTKEALKNIKRVDVNSIVADKRDLPELKKIFS